MVNKILIICLLGIFYACGSNSNTDINQTNNTKTDQSKDKVPLSEFKSWNEQKQADYLNKLGEKERMIYVVSFLKDAIIFMPPNDWVKFNKNGDISDHHSISRNNNLGVIGKWSFENGQINVTPIGDGKGMDEIFGAKEFIWKKVSAEAPQNISPAILGLNFDDGFLLQYAKTDQ
jgi:hypothetical protein